MPAMRRGLCGGLTFPNSTTTGPAAWPLYTGLTPVTGGSFEIEWNHSGSWPAWVQTTGQAAYGVPAGVPYVTGIAFGAGTSIFCTNQVAFVGCTILAEGQPSTAAIELESPSTTVASGSSGGEISSIGSWSSPSAGVLDVASGAALPDAAGQVQVATSTTAALVNYTAVSGNTLTGCTYVSGSATGTVSTGGAVTLTTDQQLIVQYCTIGPPGYASYNRMHEAIDCDSNIGTLTVDHCNLYGWEQAVHCAQTTVITNSYIHDGVYLNGDHSEPIEMASTALNLTVQNSTLLNPLPQTAVVAGSSSPSEYTLTGCLIAGGGYPVYSYAGASDIVVEGNWFSTTYYPECGNFGVIYSSAPTWGSSGNVWSGNTWFDGPYAGAAVTTSSPWH